MKRHNVLAFVMAGGEGARLYPLTASRSKPSVPFGGRYRIVDFVLSNLVNSEVHSIYLLVQYKSQELIEHIRKAWVLSPILPEQFITVVPPQMQAGKEWFQGTADAVHQNLMLIQHHNPDLVAVFGADHIYRMDLGQMVDYHLDRQADVTVAALPVPLDQARAFGVIATDDSGRVTEFQEKPEHPQPMPGDPARAYASMGNYLFGTDVLVEALEETKRQGGTDFGRDVLPALLASHRLFAYDFATNTVPGVKPYEEPAYWRDLGTIETYFDAHQDVLGRQPRFDAFNPRWPIYSSTYQGPVPKILSGQVVNSIFGAGTVIDGATVSNSVLRRESVLEEDVVVEDCIIMDYVRVGRGARLRRTIVDRYNHIPPGTRIGYELEQDRQRYHVTESGIVVVPMGRIGRFARSETRGYV
jgi:glucose-1-phosphate adenylyltransferase